MAHSTHHSCAIARLPRYNRGAMSKTKPSSATTKSQRAAAQRRTAIRRNLLKWYDANRRDLPWRNTNDPYAIWLSETMLQQTQVATVIPYYERFLRRYPTIKQLAAAPLDEVLRLWAGLGYYSRARNLHRAANEMTNRYNGRVPNSTESLRTIPGVGRYTAGAVASIAFDQRAAVVDGNVARVLARLFEIDFDIKSRQGDIAIWDCAEAMLPRRRAGDFNQALMELGAVICRPGPAAQCAGCPLRNQCAAVASGRVATLPVRNKKTPVKKETHIVLVLDRGKKRHFRQRPAGGLWGGLWEMPSIVQNGISAHATAQLFAHELFGEAADVDCDPVCEIHHQLTHRAIRFIAYRGHVPAIGLKHNGRQSGQWLSDSAASRVGISTAMRKLMAAISESPAISNGPSAAHRR